MDVVEITSTCDITKMNQLLVCNASNPIVVSLKRSATGRCCGYYIKNIGTGTATITPMLNDFIDGAASRDLLQWESIFIMDYSLYNWIVISDNHL